MKQYGTVPGQGAYRQVSLFYCHQFWQPKSQKLHTKILYQIILGQISWMHLRPNLSLHQPQQGEYPKLENGNKRQ